MTARKAARVSAEEAVKSIESGNRVIVPLCSGEPQTILEAMVADKSRLHNVEIVGGLMRNYKFLQEGLEESFHFRTWQCAPPIAKLVGKTVHYMPMRQVDNVHLFSKTGPYPIDVAVIHVSPPDRHGFCSLGVSSSHSFPTALEAGTVIAEVNEQMPRVLGKCFLHVSQMDYLVETSRPLVEFPTLEQVGDKERQIGQYVAELVPDGASLQVGIGAIPTAVTDGLSDRRGIKFVVMGVDTVVDLVERGVISKGRDVSDRYAVVAAEFLGTKKLFDFIDNNPMVENRSFLDINAGFLGGIENFISIQSAIEVDVYGQVNIETVRGRTFSAIGGSHDWLQGAYLAMSHGGKSIIAMTSTTPDGKYSRIVPSLVPGTAVAHPRHSVLYVVTEYGVACLRGKTLEERADALINIAHPDFRADLKQAVSQT